MNYSDFEAEKMKCSGCVVGSIYHQVVPSDGNKVNPTVLIIGEAPGSEEVLVGKPFVGKAGKLLRSTLNQFGFNSNNSLITNTIPCRPKNNKFPTDKCLVNECIQKWLIQEIIITNPKYILLIGATPTKYILGFKNITNLGGISKVRGQLYDLPNFDRVVKCMPTYHPSYVLRKRYMREGKEIEGAFIDDIKEIAKIACL
jgi:uracil-DNA glycosylase family 4